MEENELWFWLLSLERLGPVSHRRLFEYYGDIREIWRAKNPPLTEKQKDEFLDSRQEDRIRRSFHEMRHAGIRMVTAAEPDYPRRLRAIYDAPYGLFVKGELPNPNAPAVAIIGAHSRGTYPRRYPHYQRSGHRYRQLQPSGCALRRRKDLRGHGLRTRYLLSILPPQSV